MKCPFCSAAETKVIDSRSSDNDKSIRRRRLCQNCNRRFSTLESPSLIVVKRSGVKEPFSQRKILNGILKAVQGIEIDLDKVKLVAAKVEENIRSKGQSEVDSYDIGFAILEPLKELDHVAYLRFASVYQGFETLDDFQAAIEELKSSSR